MFVINGVVIVEGFYRLWFVVILWLVCVVGCVFMVGFNYELLGNDIGVGVGNNWFGCIVMVVIIVC